MRTSTINNNKNTHTTFVQMCKCYQTQIRVQTEGTQIVCCNLPWIVFAYGRLWILLSMQQWNFIKKKKWNTRAQTGRPAHVYFVHTALFSVIITIELYFSLLRKWFSAAYENAIVSWPVCCAKSIRGNYSLAMRVYLHANWIENFIVFKPELVFVSIFAVVVASMEWKTNKLLHSSVSGLNDCLLVIYEMHLNAIM